VNFNVRRFSGTVRTRFSGPRALLPCRAHSRKPDETYERIEALCHPAGLGQLWTAAHEMTAWLDENCGANGWAMTPSKKRGVLNALSIYVLDATLAGAFVAR
jgi:hypothetical protein